MKKIENWLILPVLLLLFYGASKYSASTTDIHLSDTYFIVSNASIARGFLTWLILVIIFFRIMRQRQPSLNRRFVVPYVVITMVVLVVWYIASTVLAQPYNSSGFSDSELNRWMLFNEVRLIAGLVFILAQVIFLIYFIVQMFRRPAIRV